VPVCLDRHVDDMKKHFRNNRVCLKNIGKDPFQLEIPIMCVGKSGKKGKKHDDDEEEEGAIPSDWDLMSQTKDCYRYWTPTIKKIIPLLSDCHLEKEKRVRLFTAKIQLQFCMFFLFFNLFLYIFFFFVSISFFLLDESMQNYFRIRLFSFLSGYIQNSEWL
jgi:hypothetical protein